MIGKQPPNHFHPLESAAPFPPNDWRFRSRSSAGFFALGLFEMIGLKRGGDIPLKQLDQFPLHENILVGDVEVLDGRARIIKVAEGLLQSFDVLAFHRQDEVSPTHVRLGDPSLARVGKPRRTHTHPRIVHEDPRSGRAATIISPADKKNLDRF